MGDLDLAEEHCSRVYTHATTRILDKKNGVKEIVKGRDRSTDLEDFNSQIGGKKGTSGTGMETGGEDGGMTTEGEMSIYLCLLKILLSNVASCRAVPISVQGETKNLSSPSSSSSSSTSSSSNPSLPLESNGTDTEKEKSNKINKSKNNLNIKNFKLSDAIEVAERCHDKIDTIAFLSLLPKNVPLFQIEKYLRIVLEFGNHKKRNLMVRTYARKYTFACFYLKMFSQLWCVFLTLHPIMLSPLLSSSLVITSCISLFIISPLLFILFSFLLLSLHYSSPTTFLL